MYSNVRFSVFDFAKPATNKVPAPPNWLLREGGMKALCSAYLRDPEEKALKYSIAIEQHARPARDQTQ
jgi:hypothetical protein